MKLKIIYEDENLLAIDKPAGIVVFPEEKTKEKTLIDYLLEEYPAIKNAGESPRYGIVHRLDKDTSGILLAAKSNETLNFLQKQFEGGKVAKKYLVLVVGSLKADQGVIETLMGRSQKDRRKQRAYSPHEPGAEGKTLRQAKTLYEVLQKFKDYTLIEAKPQTGRKHQIRCHLSHLGHPIAGDKLYGFKNQPCPKELLRQFLHASYLKIMVPGGQLKEFISNLPEDLKKVLAQI